MAFPQIADVYNYRESSGSTNHLVPYLIHAQEDEFIFGIISGWYTGDIVEYYDPNDVFQVSSTYPGTDEVRLAFFCGKAVGGMFDWLQVSTTNPYKLAYIIYRITDHDAVYASDLDGEWNWAASFGFITPNCPEPDDSVSNDYLWLNFVAYQGVCSIFTAPSGFSGTVHNTRNDSQETSVGASSRQYTGSQILSSTWINSPSSYPYITLTVRIPPGSYASGEPGFGIGKPSSTIISIE